MGLHPGPLLSEGRLHKNNCHTVRWQRAPLRRRPRTYGGSVECERTARYRGPLKYVTNQCRWWPTAAGGATASDRATGDSARRARFSAAASVAAPSLRNTLVRTATRCHAAANTAVGRAFRRRRRDPFSPVPFEITIRGSTGVELDPRRFRCARTDRDVFAFTLARLSRTASRERVSSVRSVGGLDVRSARRRRRSRGLARRDRRLRADGYRVCLVFLSLASDQGGSPAEFKHISKRRKRN